MEYFCRPAVDSASDERRALRTATRPLRTAIPPYLKGTVDSYACCIMYGILMRPYNSWCNTAEYLWALVGGICQATIFFFFDRSHNVSMEGPPQGSDYPSVPVSAWSQTRTGCTMPPNAIVRLLARWCGRIMQCSWLQYILFNIFEFKCDYSLTRTSFSITDRSCLHQLVQITIIQVHIGTVLVYLGVAHWTFRPSKCARDCCRI